MGDSYNYFLIIITVVATVMCFLANIYVLIHFQHPSDRNQAWIPKLVVVFGLSIAQISVLMLPLDVANQAACSQDIVRSACNFTLPMEELWYTVYMIMFIMIICVIPITMFYYEADSELSFLGRVWSSIQWVLVTLLVVGLTIGIAYGVAGYVDYPVEAVTAGMVPIGTNLRGMSSCWDVGTVASSPVLGGYKCDATIGEVDEETWSVRSTFPVYVIACVSVAGWALLMVFAGVGVVTLPMDLILSFVNRPKTIITKSEYISKATAIHTRASELQERSKTLMRQERDGARTRKWKRNLLELNQDLALLEDEEQDLSEVYPQGDEPDAMWAFTVMNYFLKLVLGILATVVSLCWVLHIILYMLVDPPVSPFLNDLFIALDAAFSLFGTGSFALFCFYLICCVMSGNARLGLSFLLFTAYPMKPNGTMMSSFLFNVGLICLCSISVIQFCADAFDVYANETDIQQIYGVQINHLRGLSALYTHNVFVIIFLIIAGLSLIWVLVTCGRPPKKKQRLEDFDY
ncbi:hypothetical protein CYMTET_11340 [Cymbomonas tetramitiformis]|uniref:LMBR1-like membrane protein n=1 Tax=Cymbomonas tetramitiformis TaxID=36881 RepID=A0AAE0GMG6_9CHLO|nr:hypothetical protein CYMTET_11340 [Cymbomonas tetramitiformis]